MTQLSDEPMGHTGGPWYIKRVLPMAADVNFIRYGLIGKDANGRADRIAAARPDLTIVGWSEFGYDNRDGAAGAKNLIITAGLVGLANSASTDEIPAALPPGTPIFAADDATFALTDGGGTRAGGASFEMIDENGIVWAWVGVPFRGTPLIVLGLTIGHADLDAAALTQSLNIGTALPYPARLLGVSQGEGTFAAFSGGTVATATLKIGTGSDDDALRTAEDIFTGATGFPKSGTAGVLGYVGAPLPAGTQLKAKVTTTVDNVVSLSAGAVTVRVLLAPGM